MVDAACRPVTLNLDYDPIGCCSILPSRPQIRSFAKLVLQNRPASLFLGSWRSSSSCVCSLITPRVDPCSAAKSYIDRVDPHYGLTVVTAVHRRPLSLLAASTPPSPVLYLGEKLTMDSSSLPLCILGPNR